MQAIASDILNKLHACVRVRACVLSVCVCVRVCAHAPSLPPLAICSLVVKIPSIRWLVLVLFSSGSVHLICSVPEGRPGMSDVSCPRCGLSRLSFHCRVLSPRFFFSLALRLFLSCHFSANGPFFGLFPPKLPNIFRRQLDFLYGSC